MNNDEKEIQDKIIKGVYKIFNNKYEGININDEEQLGDFIIGLKTIYEDEWKKINLINTSIKLGKSNIILLQIINASIKDSALKKMFVIINIKNVYFDNKNNQQNLSYIFAICKKLKIKKKNILKTTNNFKGLKFRQQMIYNSKKLTIINDSKSTSFSSSINLINSLNNIFWILGGLPKKGDKFKLIKNKKLVLRAFIYGKKKNFFIKNLKNKVSFETFKNLKDAFKKVILKIKNNRHQKKTIILFSPCSASFDSFKNFEERGEYFNELVRSQKIRI